MVLSWLFVTVVITTPCERDWSGLHAAPLSTRADSVRYADSLASESGGRCAELVAGYLRALTSSKVSREWRDRLSAEDELDAAFRDAAHDPRIYLAYGWLRYQAGMRVDALRLLERARDRLAGARPPLTAREHAVLGYVTGRIHQDWWRDWRSHGHLAPTSLGLYNCEPKERDRLPPPNYLPPGSIVDLNLKCPGVFEDLMDTYFVNDRDLKRDSRDAMERAYRRSIAADPSYWPPYEALATEYAYDADWGVLHELARETEVRFPRDFRPPAWLGVIAHERGRDSVALAHFQDAMTRMPDSVLALYRDPDRVLGPLARRALAQQPPEVRRAFEQGYWKSRDVLFLTDINERLTEHHARVTVADLLFREPETGFAGWDTDAGDVWIRWGRPLKIREIPANNGRAIFWSYGREPDFVFFRLLTFSAYHTDGEALHWVNRALQEEPVRHMPPGVDTILALDRQIVRFRHGDRWDVLVLAAYPAFEPDEPVTAGVTVLNAAFDPVARLRRAPTPDQQGLAVTVSRLHPGPYSIATEIVRHDRRELVRGRDTLSLVPDTALALSDLLVARAVAPVIDEESVESRRDLRFEYLFGTHTAVGTPVALYWEIYGLAPDAEKTARYEVTIEIRDATRRSAVARILRSIGRGFRSDRAAVRVSYSRSIVTDGVASEWLTVEPDWGEGQYAISVEVRDASTGRTATVTRLLTVTR